MTKLHAHLITASRTIDNLDETQLRSMCASLRRLRERDGILYIWSGTPNRHILEMFCTRGVRVSTFPSARPATTADAILCLGDLPTMPYPEPTIYAIVTPNGGDTARNANYCVVIPTFHPSHWYATMHVIVCTLAESLRWT